MENLIGKVFQNINGPTDDSSIKNAKVICLFFSASYCPPCIGFTPLLNDFYEDVNAEVKQLEIIIVPKCRNEPEFTTYFKEQPWLAIPFGDARIDSLVKHFEIKSIPTLLVLKSTGEEVSRSGRQDIVNIGPDCFVNWLDKTQKVNK